MKTKQDLDKRSTIQLTPLAIEMLLHYHCCCGPLKNQHCSAQSSELKRFLDDGIVKPSTERESGFETTEIGAAWVDALTNTKCPTEYDVLKKSMQAAKKRTESAYRAWQRELKEWNLIEDKMQALNKPSIWTSAYPELMGIGDKIMTELSQCVDAKEKLKPCPFCGNSATINYTPEAWGQNPSYIRVKCSYGCCEQPAYACADWTAEKGTFSVFDQRLELAIAKWNNRS